MGKEGSDSEKLSDPLPEEDNTEMDSDTASLNVSNEKINLPLNMKNEDTSSYPSRLTMPNDQHELNKLHCFIRDELLEIVVSSKYAAKEGETDVDCSNRSPSPSSVADEASTSMDDANHLFSGRVGFRCVHCAHTERRRKMNNARKTTGKEQVAIFENVETFHRLSVTLIKTSSREERLWVKLAIGCQVQKN
eukprot:11088255-Ditylum_brightwellii.AAC.1